MLKKLKLNLNYFKMKSGNENPGAGLGPEDFHCDRVLGFPTIFLAIYMNMALGNVILTGHNGTNFTAWYTQVQ